MATKTPKDDQPEKDPAAETPDETPAEAPAVAAENPEPTVDLHKFDNGYGAKTYNVGTDRRIAPLSPAGKVIRRVPGIEGVFPRSVNADQEAELLGQIEAI